MSAGTGVRTRRRGGLGNLKSRLIVNNDVIVTRKEQNGVNLWSKSVFYPGGTEDR